ncbi:MULTISPECIES: DUF3592 domain-containing protein [Streptomyces]|uniref:DUF3592 domain-containing protein n=1 Tax=Streptomyces solicathayae TaxID=3081768 RepID=A0ABZ0LYS6_9ACTN|nr:DUF3592 domain-containing protein [Streptomyces sp. HUAS YS2]WOX24470.1 hypothetical protein R2D22_25045 [Streptomyces sp. HUAS YS2]
MIEGLLLCFAVLSVLLFGFSLMWMKGESEDGKRAAELAEVGIEVEARLTHLGPTRSTRTSIAHYEWQGSDGQKLQHQRGVTASPVHVVGDTYPLVYHPRFPTRLKLGTMKTVRKERREREGNLRGAKRLAFWSLAVCVLSITGFVLSP